MSDLYTPPEAYVGDVVMWHDGRDAGANGYPAIVTGTGLGGIVDLAVVLKQSFGFLPKSGVRYHEDPDKRAINNTEDGVWSLTERAKQMRAHAANKLPPAKPR